MKYLRENTSFATIAYDGEKLERHNIRLCTKFIVI